MPKALSFAFPKINFKMKKLITCCSICLFALSSLMGQNGCEIKVFLKHFSNDTIWLGQTFGKRNVPDFFGVRQADESFLLKTEKPLPEGMYAIIYNRTPTVLSSFQCMLVDGQRKFTIDTKVSNPYNGDVAGSKENELLYSYNAAFQGFDRQLDDAIDHWRYSPNEENYRKRVEMENTLNRYQVDFIAHNSGTKVAKLVEQTMLPVPPPNAFHANGWEEEAALRWQWQKQHYFDKMDLSSEEFMRYPQWLEKVDFYILHLPPPSPDTAIALIDEVLAKLENNDSAFQYYNKYLTRSLERMTQFRLDEVLVHMIRKYVQTGKSTWPSDSEKQKYLSDADRLERLFEGQQGPDVTLYKKDESTVNLYSIQAPYTLMVYWMPDCGHCKKELPLIMEEYTKYKDKGLKILSVCGKAGSELPQCWEFAEEKQFPEDWFLAADPQRRSGITSLYNIRSYPRMVIFDKDKNIVFKRSGSMRDWQLDAVLSGLDW